MYKIGSCELMRTASGIHWWFPKNENKMGYGQCQEQAAGETMSAWRWVEGVVSPEEDDI